jgi:hypothetical protein
MQQCITGETMLTMDEALKLLRDGEQKQWLIAEWSWHISGSGNGGVYLGFVRGDIAEKFLDDATWNVMKGDGLTNFSIRWEDGEKRTEYSYDPISGKSWPLVIYRNFHGLEQDQFDLLEEFRLFHNLWHDRKNDSYSKILDDGTKQKVVFRDSSGAMLVDTVAIRKFCAARGLKILLQVDSVQSFDVPQAESLEVISDTKLYARRHITNESISGKPAFGRLLGKRVIEALPIEKCGVWPYEDVKTYEAFIIGSHDDGSDAIFTSNPDELADYFGKNAQNPNYLTPVHFRKDVLAKYFEKPSLYSVEDGFLRCGSKWGVRIDNDHEDKVVVFLGDLGRDLPESEQRYWRSFNIRPDGGLSETCFKRSFLAQFADPTNLDLAIKLERRKLLEKWRDAFGFDLYAEFHEDDVGVLADLRMPISDEWAEFDRCTIAATKVFIDYLNESQLAKLAAAEVAKMKANDPEKPVRGIDKLQAWLRQNGGQIAPDDLISSLRLLQELRSKSAAHRKSSKLTDLLNERGMEDESPRDVYRKLILEPMLAYCRRLSEFAENHTSH